jgi:hypothetical protein
MLHLKKKNKLVFTSCGGFFVSNSKLGLRLSFNIAEWDIYE